MLWRDRDLIIIAPRVLNTLCLLVERRGSVISKTELLETVWGDTYVEESNLTQTIFLLRKLLGKAPDGRDYVQTVVRRGYRFAAEVHLLEESAGKGEAPTDAVFQAETLPAKPDKSVAGDAPASGKPLESMLARFVALRTRHLLAATASVLVLGAFALPFIKLTRLHRPHTFSVLHYSRLTNDGYNKILWSQLVQSGDCVFFTELLEGRSALAKVCQDGTLQRQTLPETREAVFSAYGDELLLGDSWDAEVSTPLLVSSGAGAVRSLNGLVAHGAAWAPDGKSLVITQGHQILLVNPQGAVLRQIAQIAAVPFWPRWSPDGQRIRFSASDGGRPRGLFEVALNSSIAPRPVYTSEPFLSESCCGDWSPDGTSYVFVLGNTQSGSLWMSDELDREGGDGGKPQLLAEGPLDLWRAPLVAHDGRHIYAIGEHLRGELVRSDPRTGALSPWLHAASADTPSVSPDGRSVAFTAFPEGTLWRSNLDGTDRKQLTSEHQLARFPEWSPDGRWLSFITARPGAPWQVYLIPADGGPEKALYPSPSSQGVATWSQDGRHLVFGSIASYGVSAPDSAKLNLFDSKTRTVQTIAGSDGLWMARWSPDGRFIAAVSLSRHDIMLYDVTHATWQRLGHLSVNDLCWGRRSPHTLFVDSPNGGHPAIFQIDIATRETHLIADLTSVQRTGFEGWRFALDAEDAPVILRQAGTQEVYSLLVGSK